MSAAAWPAQVSFEPDHAEQGCTPGDEAAGLHGARDSIRVRVRALTMQDLLVAVAAGVATVPGLNHGATDYHAWLKGAERDADSSYAVQYSLGWEPYVVMNKRLWRGMTPHGMFDRRFCKRGWDKASFVYEAATLGYNFRAVHAVFVAHAPDAVLGYCPPLPIIFTA